MTPSDMEVACPSCGKKYVVPVLYAGRTDCCSACGASIKIPESAPSKPVTVTQIISLVVTTPHGRFKSCMVRDPAAPHMVCLALGDRLRIPIIAPALAPLLGMIPAEVGPLLNHADGIVVECPGARVPVVAQFFSDKGYSVFVVPSAVAPAPAVVRSVVPCEWGPGGLRFQMNARGAVETISWKAVKAICVAMMVREVTTVFGPIQGDLDRGTRVGTALGNVSGTVGTNLMMGPSGTQQEEVPDPVMVQLLVQSERLPAGQIECLECDERNLKYEFLGSQKAMSSSQNFVLFVRGLLEQAPHAFAPDNARAVAAGERRARVIQNRRSLTMYRRWLLACVFARGTQAPETPPAAP